MYGYQSGPNDNVGSLSPKKEFLVKGMGQGKPGTQLKMLIEETPPLKQRKSQDLTTA